MKAPGNRKDDMPRDELMAHAQAVIDAYKNEGLRAVVHFKYTCAHCGERCTLADENTLHERGECAQCGKETEIKEGGYLLQVTLKKEGVV